MIDFMIYTDTVDLQGLRSLAINAFVNNGNPELTQHLLAAWGLLQEEKSDKEVPGYFNTDADCKKRYDFYMAVYLHALGQDSGEGMEPDWPQGFLPKWFVKQIALIEGQRDKARMRQCRLLNKEINQDQSKLTPEQFEEKHGFPPETNPR